MAAPTLAQNPVSDRPEPPIRRTIAADGTGQRATLEQVQQPVADAIRAAFALAKQQSDPAITRFVAAYANELARRYAESGGDERVMVPLLWLHTSGHLDQLRGPLVRAITTAANTSLAATLSGQVTAFAAGVAVASASVQALTDAQAQQASADDSSDDETTDTQDTTAGAAIAGAVAAATTTSGDDTSDTSDDEGVDETTPPPPPYGQSTYNGQPIAGYTDAIPGKTWAKVGTAVAALLASGGDPAQMLAGITSGWMGAAVQALLIGESELTGAFRFSISSIFGTNPNAVAGWIWQAMADCCPFCSDMDQTFHDPDEDMLSHPRCRCEQLPVDNNGNVIGGGSAADASDYGGLLGAGEGEGEEAAAAEEQAAQQIEGFAARAAPQYTREDLTAKTMPQLRQIARDAGVTAARTKAETIDRILAANMTDEERVAALRQQLDEAMAQRQLLYQQQNDALDEQNRLEHQQREPNFNARQMQIAEHQAKIDLYHQALDKTDPEVKRYLKDVAAHNKAKTDMQAAIDDQRRLERTMDRLALEGKQGSADYLQAKADYDAAVEAYSKAHKIFDRTYDNLWDKNPGVFKPELSSTADFDSRLHRMRLRFSPEQIANHPAVIAARERLANMSQRIADLKAQVKGLDKSIKAVNRQVDKQLAQLRELQASVRAGTEAEALDTMRPFSDVIALPEGTQPPNAMMQKLDYRMQEPRAVTKSRIIDNIAQRLKDNPEWQAYVDRTATPDHLGVYHGYVRVQASARDTKSAKLVADWVKKWGVGYRPGSPEWVAMQKAVGDEFGLDATIHRVTAAQLARGEAYYAENGAALRALMRAQYDNTQAWFAEHGITEVDLYRGFGWQADSPDVMKGVAWGPAEAPNYGVKDMELNPFQSFSADINISQGTGGAAKGAGFAGGGFGGGDDYSLLIGAKVPIDRILSTAQTGFGAKLESEIVVMGRATDTVAYRAGTRVQSALLREAEVQDVGDRAMVYTVAADGTTVHVAANADGTFTLTYQDGTAPKIGTLKLGASKTYKTEKGINTFLKSARISNTYTAPVDLAARAGEGAGGQAAADALHAQVERLQSDASTAHAQNWLKQALSDVQQVDLTRLPDVSARLVADATANLADALPRAQQNLWRVEAVDPARLPNPTMRAVVSLDGKALYLNPNVWSDLGQFAQDVASDFAIGWHVAQTPEAIIAHEFGHLVQLNYHITDEMWEAALKRVQDAGGNPWVSRYATGAGAPAAAATKEAFAETFALLLYGQPTAAQMPIVREMATLLQSRGIDYAAVRKAVGSAPLALGA